MAASNSRRQVFLSAQWRGLAMMNWAVEPELVLPYVPRGTELDFHEGKTYVSAVGFLFLDTYLLGLPIPWHRHFEEVNLRIYVQRQEGEERRRGVAFVKEIVPRWAIATVARLAYNEPYVSRKMRHTLSQYDPRTNRFEDSPTVRYEWKNHPDWLGLEVTGQGNRHPLIPGSHAEFIAEHYWGYCPQRNGGTIEYQVEHPPWNVWDGGSSKLLGDVASFYPPEFADVLRRPADSAFLADGSAVKVFKPRWLPKET
ncbi:MAG: YqjF family protein [Planctomycetaceae bacterium]